MGRQHAIALSLIAMAAAACSSSPGLSAPEPAAAPAPAASPAGRVVAIGMRPEGIAVDPSTGLIAVGLGSPASVALLDRDGRLISTVPLPSPARHLRFAAPGGPLVAPAEKAGRVVLVGVPDGSIETSIPVGRQPHDAAAVGSRIFVGNEFSDSTSVIEGGRVSHTLRAPGQPGGLASSGGEVAVIGVRARMLEVFDATSLRRLALVRAGVGPTHVEGDGGRFYVADTQGNEVLVFSAGPVVQMLSRVRASGAPYGLALDGGRHRLWVTLTASNSLVEYDTGELPPTRLAVFPTPRQPNSVTVDPQTGVVFVTGTADGLLQIVNPADGSGQGYAGALAPAS